MSKNLHDDENESNLNENKSNELLTHPPYEEILQKLDEAEQKANQHWDRILRMQAESENNARRAERDISNAHKFALEKFISDLLPVIDSLELCVSSVPKEMLASAHSIIEGINLTLKMFYSTLEKFGVKQVNPVSETFDPEFQQAISMEYDPSVKPGTVVSVLQKGYVLNNRLVRPALVVVSKAENN